MAHRSDQIAVRIVTVGFGNSEGLVRLLNSLHDHWQGDAELIVYDNGGSRETAENWVKNSKASHLKVRVVGNAENLGFSVAVNRGAQVSGHWSHLFLINPDAWLASRVDSSILAKLAEHPGIIGLRVYDDVAKTRRQPSARYFPSWISSIANREGLLTRLWPTNPWTRRYLGADLDVESTHSVDWVSGCALWVDRSSWEKLRGFDESYFLYVEDVDLGRKAARAKIAVRYEPLVDVIHEPRGSSKKAPWKADLHHHMGMWIYHVKWSGPVGWFLGPLVFAGIWARYLLRRFA